MPLSAPLWLSIVVLVPCAWRLERRAAALLLPYLAWVSFAGGLNAAVVQLNGPFASAGTATASHGSLMQEARTWNA